MMTMTSISIVQNSTDLKLKAQVHWSQRDRYLISRKTKMRTRKVIVWEYTEKIHGAQLVQKKLERKAIQWFKKKNRQVFIHLHSTTEESASLIVCCRAFQNLGAELAIKALKPDHFFTVFFTNTWMESIGLRCGWDDQWRACARIYPYQGSDNATHFSNWSDVYTVYGDKKWFMKTSQIITLCVTSHIHGCPYSSTTVLAAFPV